MDKIDKKIVHELDKDPRISLTKLASAVRISQQVADYRLKRLFKEGFITKLSAIINLRALRLEHYRIFFTFSAKRTYTNEQIFSFLRQREGVYWAARIGGKYDLLVTLFVFDFEEHDRFIEDFTKTFPSLLKDYKSCYGLEHMFFGHKFLGNSSTSLSYGQSKDSVRIDSLDMHILNKLKENCRLSSLEIAKGTKVSYKTILSRIRRLEEKNVILGYRMFISSQEQRPFVLLFSYKEYSRQKEKRLISYLQEERHVTQLIRLYGTWNLFVHLRMENDEKLQQLLVELRDGFDIIDTYEIIPIFEDIAINLLPTSADNRT